MRHYSFLLLLFLVVRSPLSAQAPPVAARLLGAVTNNGAPVPNVLVDASLQNSSTSLQTVTDTNGRFDFGVVEGNWSLQLDTSSAAQKNLVGVELNELVANDHAVSGLGTLTTPYYSYFFAPAPNGKVYAVSGPGNFIYILSPNGTTTTLISGTGLNIPEGIAVDASGNIFVANNGNGTVAKFDTNGNYLGIFASNLGNCNGLKFDASGNLYVAITEIDTTRVSGNITKIAPDGTKSQFAIVNDPINMIFDSGGNLYVGNSQSELDAEGSIIKISPDGTESLYAGGMIEPWGMAFDGDGNLLVTDVVAQCLWLVTPSGAVSTLWTMTTPNTHLRDLIFNSEGTLYMIQSTPYSVIYTVGYNGTRTGLSLPVLAGTGAINGAVTNSAGNAFPGEQVSAQATIGGVSYAVDATTDNNGDYSFPVVSGTWVTEVNDSQGLVFGQQYVLANSSAVANFVFEPIVNQPTDATVSSGGGASFSASANTLAAGALQWQVSTDGTIWSSLSDGVIYSGSRSGQLLIHDVAISMSGYEYRLEVSYPIGSSTILTDSTVVTLTVWTPFSTWQHANFTLDQLNDAAVSGPSATPANDGITNLEKYAFNLNPLVNGRSGLPTPVVVGGHYLSLTFNALRSDLTYTVQASTDLENWTTAGVAITANGSQITASFDLTGHPQAFMRIQIEQGD